MNFFISIRNHPKRRHCISQRAVTLVEVLIAIGFLGILAMIGSMSLRVIQQGSGQAKVLEQDRDAQMAIDQIRRAIHNCDSLIGVSTTTLVLRIYDFRQGFDVRTSPSLFVAQGTMTFQYIHEGTTSFLERVTKFPDIEQRAKIFRDGLLPPDATHPLFTPYPSAENPTGAQILFRLRPTLGRKTVATFSTRVGRRSSQ